MSIKTDLLIRCGLGVASVNLLLSCAAAPQPSGYLAYSGGPLGLGTTPTAADLAGKHRYLRKVLVCPAGGVYTLGRLDESPRCSIATHRMEPYPPPPGSDHHSTIFIIPRSP